MKAKTIIGITWLLLISAVSFGDDEIAWNSLDASQQKILAEFSGDWSLCPLVALSLPFAPTLSPMVPWLPWHQPRGAIEGPLLLPKDVI